MDPRHYVRNPLHNEANLDSLQSASPIAASGPISQGWAGSSGPFHRHRTQARARVTPTLRWSASQRRRRRCAARNARGTGRWYTARTSGIRWGWSCCLARRQAPVGGRVSRFWTPQCSSRTRCRVDLATWGWARSSALIEWEHGTRTCTFTLHPSHQRCSRHGPKPRIGGCRATRPRFWRMCFPCSTEGGERYILPLAWCYSSRPHRIWGGEYSGYSLVHPSTLYQCRLRRHVQADARRSSVP